MLLSPAESPSPAPLDSGLLEVTQQSEASTAVSDGSPQINGRPSQPREGPSEDLSQSPPGRNREDPPTLLKGQKRTRSEVEDQENSLEHNNCNKRQRGEMAKERPKRVPVTKSTQGPGRATPRVESR